MQILAESRLLSALRRLRTAATPLHILILSGLLLGLAVAAYAVQFYWPTKVTYNYSSEATCYSKPALFPSLLKSDAKNYSVSSRASLSLGSFSVYSGSACLKMAAVPSFEKSEIVSVFPAGLKLMGYRINVTAAQPPEVSSMLPDNTLVSTKDTLKFKLTSKDKVFQYAAAASDKSVPCAISGQTLECKLEKLELQQSQAYELKIIRLFGKKEVGTLSKATIKTVDPISIINISIAPNSVVYDSPDALVLTASKPISAYNDISIVKTGSPETAHPIEASIDSDKIIIRFASPLARESSYRLSVGSLTATDRGFLASPFKLEFRTSGGPKVVSSSLASYGISPNTPFSVSFDMDLLPGQDFSKYISMNAPFSARLSGPRTIQITPSGQSKCTSYSVNIGSGLQNSSGIPGTTEWSSSSRTICREAFSLGVSVQGRQITGYKFGSGPVKIVYIGATHGDEIGSKYLLDSWIQELEANYPKIPADKTIIVIPVINPDGVAAGTRVNARNVDLNRNFPANTWKSDVVMPGGNLVVNGGGSEPLSEPESKALAFYIESLKPRLVLTYHSKGAMVIANESGDSVNLAVIYGKNSGYFSTAESRLGTTFAYDTTGAFENWLNDKLSLPALLVELKTHNTNEFSRNKSAMWAMVNL